MIWLKLNWIIINNDLILIKLNANWGVIDDIINQFDHFNKFQMKIFKMDFN